MSDPLVSIIMRSYNEAWALKDTLQALKDQDYRNWELIVIDSGSTDGSQDLIKQAQPAHFHQIKPSEYNPSRVMNYGMKVARSEYGIFLNADATPQNSEWLRALVTPLHNPSVAAVFGRQIPRPDCQAVFACDYERCFGPKRESVKWEHFFSMVSSGIRKDIWSIRGFLEKLQYAEDDEYTRWAKAQGYKVIYCPRSIVMHSHNYTSAQAYKRSFGDARALAASWQGSPDEFNWFKTVLLGWISDYRHDVKYCLSKQRWTELSHAAFIRWHQRRGKLDGFRNGWVAYRQTQNENTRTHQSLSASLSRGI
ncbi:MAG: glycosyltransferase family 2 protein [Verrucomicrobiota bacterium]